MMVTWQSDQQTRRYSYRVTNTSVAKMQQFFSIVHLVGFIYEIVQGWRSTNHKIELLFLKTKNTCIVKLFSGAVDSALLYSFHFHHDRKATTAEASRRGAV